MVRLVRERRERIEKRAKQAAEEGTPPPGFVYHYGNVDGLGSVNVSAHAAKRVGKRGMTREDFEDVLLRGTDHDAGVDTVYREKDGAVLVVKLHADKSPGDAVVITIFFRHINYDPLQHDKFKP